ncbi:MAG: GNAT family N-acetyltransferase [Phycisphaerales bacterium]
MKFTIRPIDESEIQMFRAKIARGFGGDLHKDDDPNRLFRLLDVARTVCAFDGQEMIGTCGAFSLDLTVPGATLPMGGTTVITVQPTHRRRGVLRAMMQAHLKEIQFRSEPLAGLWASESSIYGRFGYGLAAQGYELKLDGKAIQFADDVPAGSIKLLEPEEAQGLLPEVYERVRPTRPGMFSRTDTWWEAEAFYDPEHRRQGKSAKRYAVYVGATGAEGYAIYRQKDEWTDFPKGEVHILELVASTLAAHKALWRFLTSIDLYPDVRYWNAPVDDELPWQVTDPRRVQRSICDSLWLRLIDIPRALAGRSYSGDGQLVLGVRDTFLPENDGSYELEVTSGGAQCRRSSAPADIKLSVEALGATYLGAHRFTALARAGLVHGDAEALATADRLFSWDRLPWCPEVF